MPGNDATHFNLPTDVAVRPDGGFFVSDGYENTRVVSFSADGAFLSQWGVKGSGAGEFDLPHGIALDADGRVYVADRSNARVQIFDGGGRFLSQWQQKELGRPYAVAIGGDGKAYVVDGGDPPQTPPDRARAMRLSLDGRIEPTFGRYGNYDGQFMLGHDIAAGRDGAVYVVDAWGQRVQKFTTRRHASEETRPQTLLGRGNGIDHVTVMTDDLAAATATYVNRLGFAVRPFAKYPDGYAMNEPEGILWNSLRVESLQRAVDILSKKKDGVFGPETVPEGAAGDDWMFRLGGLKDRALGGRFMLIEWNDVPLPTDPAKRAARDRRRTHANTARRLHSVWIGVRNLEDAVRAYRNLGLPAGRPIEFPALRAVGQEIAAGTGTILLLQAAGAGSDVTAFLGSRADAYMGISVEVSDLQAARAFLRSNMGGSFEEYDGRYGRGILVPARQAHGVWIEMLERLTAGGGRLTHGP